PAEVESLFHTIEHVTHRGTAVLYVTHRLREVYQLAADVTVLRDGRKMVTAGTETLPSEKLVALLSGNSADAAGAADRDDCDTGARDSARAAEGNGSAALSIRGARRSPVAGPHRTILEVEDL